MKTIMNDLSVIIVSYNTKGLLRQCLDSLRRSAQGLELEAIVVDNASSDGSPSMVSKDYPWVRLIENTENLGFARANNIALGAAAAQYVMLLNSDTVLMDSSIKRLLNFLKCNPDTAVAAPRLVYPDLTDQGVARNFPTPMNALFGRRSFLTRIFPNNRFSEKYLLSRSHGTDEPFEVDWVSGACMMLNRNALDEVGLLDEGFWMYWEDADLCYRIKERGWKVWCVPASVVIHFEGKSSAGKTANRCIIEFNRSVYRYYRKHHIRSPFSIMNAVAVLGLTARTFVLLAANAFKPLAREEGDKGGGGLYEKT